MTETAGRSSDLALTAPARMDPALLDDLLADGPSLRYVSQWHDQASAVLEFEADLGGVYVQGVDILRWNAEGKLVGSRSSRRAVTASVWFGLPVSARISSCPAADPDARPVRPARLSSRLAA